jgi:hypothetical protein
MECSAATAESSFAHIDVCRDGKISKGELVLVDLALHHKPLDVTGSERRVKELFDNLDLNKDGTISRDEWVASWDKISSILPGLMDKTFYDQMEQFFHMTGPKVVPLYASSGVSTFLRKPLYGPPSQRLPADCVFFGCPFDSGSTYRSGNRFGPKAIREASQILLTDCATDYAPWVDRHFGRMKIFDAGDAHPTPFDLVTAVNQIYVYAKVLWNTSLRVIGIGGDHTLSWSILAAARDRNEGRPIAVVHLDAHLDTGVEFLGSQLSHGTSLGRAGAMGCINFQR